MGHVPTRWASSACHVSFASLSRHDRGTVAPSTLQVVSCLHLSDLLTLLYTLYRIKDTLLLYLYHLASGLGR